MEQQDIRAKETEPTVGATDSVGCIRELPVRAAMAYGGLGKAQAGWGSSGWGVGRHCPSTDSVCSHLRTAGMWVS